MSVADFHRDRLRLYFLCLGESQIQHAVLIFRFCLISLDFGRKPYRAVISEVFVFADQPGSLFVFLFFVFFGFTLDGQNTLADGNVDVILVDTGHP